MQTYAAGGFLPNRKRTIMKKTVKYLALFLCAVLSAVTMGARTAYAEETVVLSAGSAKGGVGDTVTIPVDIRNSSQVATLDITVVYDPDELSFVSASKGDAVKDGNICDINPIPEKACIRFVFTSLKEIQADGNVMELTFKVLREEPEEHTVDVNVIDVFDMDIQALSWTTEGGREIAPEEEDGNTDTESTGDGKQPDAESGITSDPYDWSAETENSSEEQPDASQSGAGRRFFAKTEDGIKDVTDTAASQTGADLLDEGSALAESETTDDRMSDTGTVMPVAVCVVIILLIAAGVIVYKIRKK